MCRVHWKGVWCKVHFFTKHFDPFCIGGNQDSENLGDWLKVILITTEPDLNPICLIQSHYMVPRISHFVDEEKDNSPYRFHL